MKWTESGIQFQFGPAWAVQPYDRHRFYKSLSGRGLSGVDFLGLLGGKLYLFEVKNFRRRQHWQTAEPIEPVLAAPQNLSQAVAKKVEDTEVGIDAIGQYYHRRPLFRWTEPWLRRRVPPTYEWAFWARAYALLDTPEQLRAVLWLETDQTSLELRQTLERQLENHLGLPCLVLGSGHNALPDLIAQLDAE